MQNLDVLVGDSSEGDISSRVAAFAKKASADRTRYEQEILRIEKLLGESEAEKRDRGLDSSTGLTTSLQRTVSALATQINSVRHLLFIFIHHLSLPPQLHDRNADLERKLSESLLDLEDRTQELETTRKRSNRDVPFGVQDVHKAITPKYDASTLREEVAGLKYVRSGSSPCSLTSKSDILFRTCKKITLLLHNESNIWSPRTNSCLLRPSNFVK
jgi:CAP-Gly domain-containing linker protein 1